MASPDQFGDFTQPRVLSEHNITGADVVVSCCEACKKNSVWFGEKTVYPATGQAPLANTDMPAEVQADYDEAARIYMQSPRGAAALLRLAIQKLMVYLGESGRDINQDIKGLVAKGLPAQIQQALDVVRVTGNNAVHPGKLDANDAELVEGLFTAVNMIVMYQVSMPNMMQQMYQGLPAGALDGIAKRDGKP